MTMADYIDRDEAIAALTEFRDDQTVSKYVSVENCMVARGAIERATKVLENLPAADVAPVRHGRWLTWEEQFPGRTPKKQSGLGVFCDKCHNHADNRTDYCPNCGAKMDEVSE